MKTTFVRDGKSQIIGSTTSGLPGGGVLARDQSGKILGHSSALFHNTRDGNGRLVSQNQADVNLLFRR